MRIGQKKARPAHVQRAIVGNNVEQLRQYGEAGARATNEKKAQKAEVERYFKEEREKAEWERIRERNEHIVPIDSDQPNLKTE